ncbi:MAG: hypothetical protein ABII20_05340 [Candidatus Omnitrophota bacterium]|nr:hypothetical protein [Candidatus Omnitrophota bacterium]MBU2528320.1 hypothetical protein [bacterium]MBU3930035.1 hypothetical protein [bacterium]MBU4123376.1 hypothetical protein [bacterium]
MGAKGWEINNKVKGTLTRNWVDVPNLSIGTVRDVVVIKGDLKFKGGKVSADSETAVIDVLKKIERELRQGADIKMIKWELTQWEKRGGKWYKKKLKHESGA